MMINVKPGDIGIVPSQVFHHAHVVVRVVKVGKVMWDVETYRHGGWDYPARRKIEAWLPLPPDADPASVRARLSDLSDVAEKAIKEARLAYHEAVRALSESPA